MTGLISLKNEPTVRPQPLPGSDEFLATTCAECHRRLKSMQSRRLGLGPVCAHKLAVKAASEKNVEVAA